jgi:putative transposase
MGDEVSVQDSAGDVAERARDLLRQICMAREVTIMRGAVSPDHIHMLIAAPPQLSPSKLVQFLKGRSSRLLQQEFPALRKRYWGQHLWARGYYCASVGAVDEKAIREYIENQRWDEDTDGLKITAPTEP